jgi:hypothetical protein
MVTLPLEIDFYGGMMRRGRALRKRRAMGGQLVLAGCSAATSGVNPIALAVLDFSCCV